MCETSVPPQVLPPLTEVKIRPEVGTAVRNKLVRLMTHVDMGVKQTAAEFLFVLCKESGERNGTQQMEERDLGRNMNDVCGGVT